MCLLLSAGLLDLVYSVISQIKLHQFWAALKGVLVVNNKAEVLAVPRMAKSELKTTLKLVFINLR